MATPALPTSPVTRSWSESYPAMRGKIEGDGKPPLSCGEIAAVKCVGLFGGRESCILPDRPRLHHIHCAVRPAQIRRNSGGIVEMLKPFKVLLRIETLDRNVLGR